MGVSCSIVGGVLLPGEYNCQGWRTPAAAKLVDWAGHGAKTSTGESVLKCFAGCGFNL